MSPLHQNDKERQKKDLENAQQQVDRKTDSAKPKTPQNQARIDTSELPADVAEIVAIWPELPEHIKAAIKALIQTHNRGDKVNGKRETGKENCR